jgi:hypothetical protein
MLIAFEVLPRLHGGRPHFLQVDKVRDTNGAGDTFATAYMLALSRGLSDPGHHAAWAASRAVMQAQSCKPQCAADLIEGHVPVWGPADRAAAALRGLLRASGAIVGLLVKEGMSILSYLSKVPHAALSAGHAHSADSGLETGKGGQLQEGSGR